MTMKVAVAGVPGKHIIQHYGAAHVFHIYEIINAQPRFLESRETPPVCQSSADEHDDALARSVERLADCQVVVVSRIGPGPAEALRARGIHIEVINGFIDQAVQRLATSLTEQTEKEQA
jgi:predicted Fe-Mo cluster-binding NifX family protein